MGHKKCMMDCIMSIKKIIKGNAYLTNQHFIILENFDLPRLAFSYQQEEFQMSIKIPIALFLCLLILSGPINLSAEVVSRVDQPIKLKFASNAQAPVMPWCFCITEDELVIIPDVGAKNIKLYEIRKSQLQLIKTFSREGYSQGELQKPLLCFYNKSEGRLGVLDLDRAKIIVFDRVSRTEFDFFDEFYCPSGAYDFNINEDQLLISGFQKDEKGTPFDLYFYTLTTRKISYLLRSTEKYGMESNKYYERYIKDIKFQTIGIKGYVAINDVGMYAYYLYEGNLERLLKVKLSNNEITEIKLKPELSKYKKPSADDKLKKWYQEKNIRKTEAVRAKMFYVRGLYTQKDNVITLFQGPDPNGGINSWLLVYNEKTGDQKELLIPGPIDKFRQWFEPQSTFLYTLLPSDNKNQNFRLIRYKIKL